MLRNFIACLSNKKFEFDFIKNELWPKLNLLENAKIGEFMIIEYVLKHSENIN